MRSLIPKILAWLITGVALIYALHGVDMGQVTAALAGFRWDWVGVAVALQLAILLANGLRKKLLLGIRCPVEVAVASAFLCLGYNCLLPLKGGDVVHTVYLSRRLGLPLGQLTSILVWERFFDVHMLFLLLALLAMTLNQDLFSPLLLATLTCGLLACWTGFLLCKRNPDKVKLLLHRVPWQGLCDFMVSFGQGFQMLCSPRLLVSLLGGTLAIWGFGMLFFLYAYHALLGLSLREAFLAGGLVLVSSVIPASQGSLGVFEVATVMGLGLAGVAKDNALSVALITHAFFFIIPVTGCICVLLLDKHHGTQYAK